MRRRTFIVAAFSLATCTRPPDHSAYVVDRYDPSRDARADLAGAVARASAEHKRILIIVGGDWCAWCRVLEDFIQAHDDVRAELAAAFVILKVNYDLDHPNTAFLSAYPPSRGYPDFFILDSNGAFLAQQGTGEFEQGRGRGYNSERLIAFARRWRI
jgi:thioredoxin-related protein